MKTPEQIADEMFNSDISLSQDDKAVIIAAIKADRAQRPTLDEAEFDQITDAMSGLVRGLERGREYVTLAEAQAAEELIRSKFGPALHDDWME